MEDREETATNDKIAIIYYLGMDVEWQKFTIIRHASVSKHSWVLGMKKNTDMH